MSDPVAIRRQLKIKSGVATRLLKEHTSYRKEAEQQQRKLDGFIAAKADDWDVGNARRMMDESERMIKDSDNRLGLAVGDLRSLIISVKKDPAMAGEEELAKAEEALQAASV